MAPGAQGAPRRLAHPAHRHAPAARAQHGAPDRPADAARVHSPRDRHHGDQARSGDHRAPLNEPDNSQPIAIAPEMPISTTAPTTSPCSPAAAPSFPPSFSPIIDITKLMSPNRVTAKTIGERTVSSAGPTARSTRLSAARP